MPRRRWCGSGGRHGCEWRAQDVRVAAPPPGIGHKRQEEGADAGRASPRSCSTHSICAAADR
jgi:hypothetical protein